MNAQTNTNEKATVTANLDRVWEAAQENSLKEFLRDAITPDTTVQELIGILSYDKVAAAVKELPLTLAEILQLNGDTVSDKDNKHVGTASPPRSEETEKIVRKRITEGEETKILQALSVKGQNGMRRADLIKMLARKGLPNFDVHRLGYTLQKMEKEGKVHHTGAKRATTWFTNPKNVS